MRPFLIALFLCAVALPARALFMVDQGGSGITADIRMRQELLKDAYYFDSDEQDRSWIRLRSRVGLRYQESSHIFELRFCNEFRKILTPDIELDLDEVILDRLFWRFHDSIPFKITLGRQPIIWNDRSLMLEGHPYDGSRSIYQNALRVEGDDFEVVGIFNPKRDPLVLAGDEERALAPAREAGLALNIKPISFIYKNEHDPDHLVPDFESYTFSTFWAKWITWQTAFQYQKLEEGGNGWAHAHYASWPLLDSSAPASDFPPEAVRSMFPFWHLQANWFYYSGQSDHLAAYRAPWGRWPMWSELLIYTLIPEGGVAAWQNIAGPALEFELKPRETLGLKLAVRELYAPEPDWSRRGTLFKARLDFTLAFGTPRQKLASHLLWEGLDIGPAIDAEGGFHHFLRWELNYELR